MAAQGTYGQHPDVVMTSVDDELMLLDPRRNATFVLDPVGRRIWELLATPQTAAQLCARLSQEYDAPPERIAADVQTFLEALVAKGVVVEAGTTTDHPARRQHARAREDR